jgi:hypothetical protein
VDGPKKPEFDVAAIVAVQRGISTRDPPTLTVYVRAQNEDPVPEDLCAAIIHTPNADEPLSLLDATSLESLGDVAGWQKCNDRDLVSDVWGLVAVNVCYKGGPNLLGPVLRQHIVVDAQCVVSDSLVRPRTGLHQSRVGEESLYSARALVGANTIEGEARLILATGVVYRAPDNARRIWMITESKFIPYSNVTVNRKNGFITRVNRKSLKTAADIVLLSTQNILANLSRYAPAFVEWLLCFCEQAEASILIRGAQWRIVSGLQGLSYLGGAIRPEFMTSLARLLPDDETSIANHDEQHAEDHSAARTSTPPWLQCLFDSATKDAPIGSEQIDVSDTSSRCTFYRTILNNSVSESVREQVDALIRFASDLDVEPLLLRLAAARKKPRALGVHPLLLFEFFGRSYIIGIPPKGLPDGLPADVPRIDASTIRPVFVSTRLSESQHLDLYYKRVRMIKATLEEYPAQDRLPAFCIAKYAADIIGEDVDQELLYEVVCKRAPFHERRLLQMVGVPCRQAMEDAVFDDVAASTSETEEVPPYHDLDRRLAACVARHQERRSKVDACESLESLRELLLGKPASSGESESFANPSQLPLLTRLHILTKTAQLSPRPPNKDLDDYLGQLGDSFRRDGQFLAQALCNTIVQYSSDLEAASKSTKAIVRNIWVRGFWRTLGECFPDGASSKWLRMESSVGRYAGSAGLSRYTASVLASVFDRQITTFYELASPLPHLANSWARYSIHRIHLLSAMIPVCCGDWVCSHRYDEFSARREAWAFRIAASVRQVPGIVGNTAFRCASQMCHHFNSDTVLMSIGRALHLEVDEVSRVVARMGWWFNSLLDVKMHRHFRCAQADCGRLLAPVNESGRANVFACPLSHNDDSHDSNVYLSWCIGPSCENIIDSRATAEKCSRGMIRCPSCGRCCAHHEVKPSETDKVCGAHLPACRSCFKRMSNVIPLWRDEKIPDCGTEVTCLTCKVVNRVFPASSNGIETDDAAIQGSALGFGFKYRCDDD